MPTISLPQGPISYRDTGAGEPLVFVHGYLMDGRLWRQITERLEDRFRCIAPDWPLGAHRTAMDRDADLSPHGLAAIVAAFLDALDLDGVTLVGNDSGGAISQLVAVHHPERLARLVLTSCDAFDNFPPKAFRPLVAASKVPGGLRAALAPLRIARARRLPIAYGWLAKRGTPDDLLADWVAPWFAEAAIRHDLRKVTRGLHRSVTLAVAQRLHEFDRPVLLAWAAEDRFFPVTHARRLATLFAHAKLVEIEDSWTFVMLDQPQRLADEIAAFAGGKVKAERTLTPA